MRRFREKRLAPHVACATTFLLCVCALLAGCSSERVRPAAPPGEPADRRSPTTGAASAGEGAPLADAELARLITQRIEESDFASARWGIQVVSLRDDRVLYARDAGRPLTPASNMKLYTTAVALNTLGADYRWRTSVYAREEPDAAGAIAGDLVLYGRGAPDLASRARKNAPVNHLAQLADDLYRRGLRRVRGDVVGDESYFDGESFGDGWLWSDLQWYFGAEPSALSIDDNEVIVQVGPAAKADEPAEVRLLPPTDYVRVVNDASTVARGTAASLGITRALSSNDVRVWGDLPVGGSPYSVRLSVHGPALWAARLFRSALTSRGIEVEGEARRVDRRTREGERLPVPGGAVVELAYASSRPLGEVVREVNKESLNLQAELLLRTVGRERGAELAPLTDPDRMRRRRTDQAGLDVLRVWLGRAGIPIAELALHDGSGLSRLNLVTPAATVRLLVYMAHADESARIFRDSLPLAGRDGTLENRLRAAGRDAAGRIAAKTGSLTYVSSLSGYATTAAGEPLAFSVICNDETERASVSQTIDAIALLLAAYPDFKE